VKPFLIFCCVALMFVSACGKKGNPRAPELAIPEVIKDLKVKTGDRGIALTWSRPKKYVDGQSLDDLAGFVIFRKDLPKTSSCPDCPVPFRPRTTVNIEDHQKFIKKKKYRFVDEELSPQTVYRYRVFSRLMDGSLSRPSNEVEAAWKP